MPFIGLYIACLMMAALVSIWLMMKPMKGTGIEKWLTGYYPIGLVITIFLAWQSVLLAPHRRWNGVRIARTLALIHGYKLYYPRDSGPVIGNIYLPLDAVAYLPAALATSPVEVIQVGAALSLFFYFGPFIWLARMTLKRMARTEIGWDVMLARISPFLLLPVATYYMRSLAYSAGFIHADAPALGFAAAACVFVYAFPKYGFTSLLASAFCLMFSVLSKQVMVPLFIAIPCWMLLAAGLKTFLRYLAALTVAGVVVGGFTLALIDPSALFFNTVVVPGGHPWPGVFPFNVARVASEMQAKAFPLVIILLFGVLFLRVGQPATNPGLSAWLAQHRWTLFILVFLFELPTSILGRLKLGGDINTLSPALYFLLVSVCVMLSDGMAATSPVHVRLSFQILTLVLLGTYSLVAIQAQCRNYLDLQPKEISEQQMVFSFIKAHPGQAYFPWHPLGHLMAEGQLYHFEYGLYDRELAGFPISQSHFQEYVPPSLSLVCLPSGYEGETARKYLREFTRLTVVDELPGFTCYRRQ